MTENLIERQDLLIAQLRSGNYVQGTGRLKTNDGGFCCLGVACDIYAKATGLGLWDIHGSSRHMFVTNEYAGKNTEILDEKDENGDVIRVKSGSVLIKDVQDWFGFKDCGGQFNGDAVQIGDDQDAHSSSLMGLNDNGMSFSSIADVIELRRKDIFND